MVELFMHKTTFNNFAQSLAFENEAMCFPFLPKRKLFRRKQISFRFVTSLGIANVFRGKI